VICIKYFVTVSSIRIKRLRFCFFIKVHLHGETFTWGNTLEDALENACYLEESASLAYLSLQLDPGLISYK